MNSEQAEGSTTIVIDSKSQEMQRQVDVALELLEQWAVDGSMKQADIERIERWKQKQAAKQ